MSKKAEEAYEAWFKGHLEECARVLVVGARVYRANYNRIEEGEVRKIDRVRFTANREEEDPNGPVIRYWASFNDHNIWESQTYQWKWFFRREDAQKDLVQRARDRAKDLRAEADRWDALASVNEGGSNG
jgi:hypothetical protein